MSTTILKSFHTLQSELEKAKKSLEGVDKNIERLTGGSFSKIVPYTGGIKRGRTGEGNRRYGNQGDLKRKEHEDQDEPPAKRYSRSVFERLAPREPQKLISKVVVSSREVPSRKNASKAQHVDENSKARNVRMFGALLTTLQKFQQEETKFKPKELKRAKIEKKIEEYEIRKKEEVKMEKQELYHNRRRKQAEIKTIELKMLRIKKYATWQEKQKPKLHFIYTKAKPRLYYLPNILNETAKSLLKISKTDLEEIIEKRKEEMYEELQLIEDGIKENFKLEKLMDSKCDEKKHEGDEEDETRNKY